MLHRRVLLRSFTKMVMEQLVRFRELGSSCCLVMTVVANLFALFQILGTFALQGTMRL
jgi:hypothetical protein